MFHHAQTLPKELHIKIEEDYLEEKKGELRNHIDLARNAIKNYYSPDADKEAKAKAMDKLRALRYNAEDGYFFVYDIRSGENLVHPLYKEWEGEIKINLTDCTGKYVVKDLIKTVREGDGFDTYMFKKPSTPDIKNSVDPCRDQRRKLAYVVMIDDFFMLGTGIYFENVDNFLDGIDDQIKNYTNYSMIVIFIITCLSVFILSFTQMRIGKRIGEEKQKFDLAVSLHEEIQQDLAVVIRGLANKIIEIDQSTKMLSRNELKKFLVKMKEVADKAFNEIIIIRTNLTQPVNPLVISALQVARMEFIRREQIPVEFVPSDEVSAATKNLSKEKNKALVEIAREALRNIGKHAAANRVDIELQVDACNIMLTIHDDGTGFKIANIEPGFGLSGMEERMKKVGGTLKIISILKEGTNVIAVVPRDQNIWRTLLCLLKRSLIMRAE
ncbi:MAG: cache domain-containing protein [Nitrosomonas sp.]